MMSCVTTEVLTIKPTVTWNCYLRVWVKVVNETVNTEELQKVYGVASYLVGAGGSSTAWEGADTGATTAAVPTVTG